MLEYFVGLTFRPSSIHYKKIQSFRERFDSKYQHSSLLQLTLVPPFQIDFKNNPDLEDCEDEMRELLEGHLYGLDDISPIEFSGISFMKGEKGVLSLTPTIPADLLYCQESLYQSLKDRGAHFLKSKNTTNTFLPIGRLDFADQLENAIEIAKLEFSSPFILQGESFVLFEKKQKKWGAKNNLFDFKLEKNVFLENEL
jgi:hypothetical protein